MELKKILSSLAAFTLVIAAIPLAAATMPDDAPKVKAVAYSYEEITQPPTYPQAYAELYQPSDELLFVGNSFYLGYLDDPYYSNETFSSSDESIATVDKDGLVTILSTGTVTITEEVGYKNSAYSDYATDSITLEITKESIDAEPTSEGLTYEVQYDGTAVITGYEGSAVNVEIPETIDGLTVSGLEEYCFSGNTNISSVKISGAIGTISAYAFRGCKNLKSIDIGSNITSIDTYAFYGCSLLEEIILPDTLKTISTYSFYNCDSLKTIDLPEITSIGSCAFFDCDGLESITIPGSVSSIESDTFYWCDNLKTITIEYGVRSIKEEAFSYCSALETVTIPESVTSIGGYAFENCYALESISIPGSVQTINDYTFDCCNELKNIVLGEGVQEISDKAFYIYDYDGDIPLYLESITLPGTISVVPDYAFRYFTTLKSVTIGEGTTGIGIGAFSCTGLEEITIPGTVNVINSSAFANCTSLKTVTIKDGVKSIGESAFSGCTTLETVIIPASVVQIKDTALNSSFIGTIYGYEGSAAQTYAEKYGYTFELLTEQPEILYGDTDLSGEVELNDAVKIMCWIADEQNNPMTDEEQDAADVYQRGDGLNNMDALAIQKKLAQLIPELPESTL